ncbi:hypothetical protein F4680DRAFT_441126 [Xylaria scruposa]|nr:hypothetical protein F4680DRAFT_441126 [Xylaria scruposa]
MANFQSLGRLSVLLLASDLPILTLAVLCYHLDGNKATSDLQACDLNSTGQGGAHSACCKLMNQDACLSTGLCLNTLARQASHMLWSTGCTDPTFQDPSCPKYCVTSGLNNARLQNCNDTHYCCAEWDTQSDQAACCSSSFPLGEIGIVTRQIHSTDTNLPEAPGNTTSSDNNTMATCPNTNMIPTRAIVGLSVESGALLVALVVLGYMAWNRRRLKKEINQLNTSLMASRSGHAGQVSACPPNNEMSELPSNPQELPTLSEPSELQGTLRGSRVSSLSNFVNHYL